LQKIDINLIVKLYSLKSSLSEILGESANIGEKIGKMERSIFVNEYLQSILNENTDYNDQTMMREYYRLYTEGDAKECSDPHLV